MTNQAGIAKGFYSEKQFHMLNDWMHKQFNLKGCFIDDVYYCPYHPSAKIKKYKKKSNLRKPGNGMIIKALKDWKINKNKSFMIGDKEKDIICGKKSNLRSYYVEADIYYQIKNPLAQTVNEKNIGHWSHWIYRASCITNAFG